MDKETRISRSTEGDVAILTVAGDITGFSENDLAQAHKEVLEQGLGKLILSLEGVDYINSAGIAVFIDLFMRSEQHAQKVAICGLKPYFRKIFKMVGLTKFTALYTTKEEAIESF
ncbi:MAG: STAS domain-containing protein [Candidatus Schekmanbacteria bacterium]|nr:STAS domain-containing protein [Candidatus Schekmanbacteria bacterium]